MQHGAVISFADLKNLPGRNDRMDVDKRKIVDQLIKSKKPVWFLPTAVTELNKQDIKYQPAVYKIILWGILLDGRKVAVQLNGIEPYFDIMIPREDASGKAINNNEFIAGVKTIISELEITPRKMTMINARKFKYYDEVRGVRKFLRIYFTKNNDRVTVIKKIRSLNYETATDDFNHYYRVWCRNQRSTLSNWVYLTQYSYCTDDTMIKDELFELNHTNYIKPLYDHNVPDELRKDNTLVLGWDIETRCDSGDVPKPEMPDAHMISLSMVFQTPFSKNAMFKICLCDLPAAAHPNYLTVVCGSETNIIKAFGMIFAKMKPDIITGFNDSNYDWDFVIKRAAQTNGLLIKLANWFDAIKPWKEYTDDIVARYKYVKESVKVEAGINVEGSTLQLAGYIPIDVQTVFRQLYPTSEKYSLAFFLSKCKLNSKENMPHKKLHAIATGYRDFYKNNSKKITWTAGTDVEFKLSDELLDQYCKFKAEYADINHYCVVDSQRCHDLLMAKNIIMDKRQLSNMAYVTIYDSFYRAGGMKVRNLTIAECQRKPFSMLVSNVSQARKEIGKYPGAFVFPPEKGCKTSKLSIEERIKKAELTKNTQRPSMQEWSGVSFLDTMILVNKIIEKYGITAEPETIKQIEAEHGRLPTGIKNFLKENTGRPITGLDFSSLYPSLIRTYNFSPEYAIMDEDLADELRAAGHRLTEVSFPYNGRQRRAWFLWHNNEMEPVVCERFIMADGKIKLDVFGNKLTEEVYDSKFQFGIYPYILNRLFNERAQIKAVLKKYNKQKEHMEAEGKANTQAYEDLMFNQAYYNAKQNALKVFMNTFYGEAGNQISPFFILELAGGVTTYGIKNIKLAYEFVKSKGCRVYYGDTDSLYLSVPEVEFATVDKQYYTGAIPKIDYWTRLVEITFDAIKSLRIAVNQMFKDDNGTDFLTMAYEEVLFPSAFCAKKKYYGIAHEEIVNFKPKDMFVRGLDIKKRGVSDILKKICESIMWTSLSVDNIYELLELVQDAVDRIYTTKWDFADFIQTDVYKPNKKNVKVHTFVARMKAQDIIVPAHERYNYVIVKKYPYRYDYRGRKEELSIGDKIELIDQAAKNNYEIDLDHYVQNSINGQLARLAAYHESFHVDPITNTPDDLAVAEKKIYDNACKFMFEYGQRYYSYYNQFGKTYQKIFNTVNKIAAGTLAKNDTTVAKLLTANVDLDKMDESMQKMIARATDKKFNNFGRWLVEKQLENYDESDRKRRIEIMQKAYFGESTMRSANLIDRRTAKYKETMAVLRGRLRTCLSDIVALYQKFHTCFADASTLVGIPDMAQLLKPVSGTDAKSYTVDDVENTTGQKIDMDEGKLSEYVESYFNRMTADSKLASTIKNLKYIYHNMLIATIIMKRNENIVDYLKSIKHKANRYAVRPADSVIRQDIQAAIADAPDID